MALIINDRVKVNEYGDWKQVQTTFAIDNTPVTGFETFAHTGIGVQKYNILLYL